MTTTHAPPGRNGHAPAPPRPDHPPPKPGFARVTRAKLGIPVASRHAPPGAPGFTHLQKQIAYAFEILTSGGKHDAAPTDFEIAEMVGEVYGPAEYRCQKVNRALHGYSYRKRNKETGKRDGELVRKVGLDDPVWGLLTFEGGPGRRAGKGCGRGGRPPKRRARLRLRYFQWIEWAGRPGPGGPDDGRAGPVAVTTPARETSEAIEMVPACADPGGRSESPVGQPLAPCKAEASVSSSVSSSAPRVAPAGPGPVPPAETLDEVFGEWRRDSKENLAHRLLRDLAGRNLVFRAEPDGTIRQVKSAANAGPPTAAEAAVIRWLRPEVLAILNARQANGRAPAAAGAEAPAGTTPLGVFRGEVTGMIDGLTGRPAPDDSDCQAVAERIAGEDAFMANDEDPATTRETLLGLARDTKRGNLPPGLFRGGFEDACKAKKVRKSRPAVLVESVKRRIGRWKNPDP